MYKVPNKISGTRSGSHYLKIIKFHPQKAQDSDIGSGKSTGIRRMGVMLVPLFSHLPLGLFYTEGRSTCFWLHARDPLLPHFHKHLDL